MTRESFVFYRSWFEAGKKLKENDRLAYYDRILRYALNGDDTPSESNMAELLFGLCKDNIDANNRKYEAGKKGGRPTKNRNTYKLKLPEYWNKPKDETPVSEETLNSIKNLQNQMKS